MQQPSPGSRRVNKQEKRAAQRTAAVGNAFGATCAGRDRGTIREIRLNCRNSCTQARTDRSDRLILEQDLTRNIPFS